MASFGSRVSVRQTGLPSHTVRRYRHRNAGTDKVALFDAEMAKMNPSNPKLSPVVPKTNPIVSNLVSLLKRAERLRRSVFLIAALRGMRRYKAKPKHMARDLKDQGARSRVS